MANDNFVWTEQVIALLTRLWTEGLTTAEIGARLGVGKNSVIGKVHRLALPPRESPIRRAAAKEKPAKPAARSRTVAPSSRRTLKALFAARKPILPRGTRPATDMNQAECSVEAVATDPTVRCCFPLWRDGRDADKRYCEKPAQAGKGYCPGHYALCVVPVRRKLDIPATA